MAAPEREIIQLHCGNTLDTTTMLVFEGGDGGGRRKQ